MIILSAITVLLFTTCVSSGYSGLDLSGCHMGDQKCFNNMYKQFLEETYKGIPEYNIKPIDPLYMPSFNVTIRKKAVLNYKNLTIKGLKDEELQTTKFDAKESVVELVTIENPVIKGKLTLTFTKGPKIFNGSFIMDGTTLVTARCGYHFTTDGEGLKHILIDPENTTITCRALGKLVITLSPGLVNAVNYDKPFYELEIRKLYCKIIKEAYTTVIHNVRKTDEVVPAKEIVKDV